MRSPKHAKKLRMALGMVTIVTLGGLAIALPGSAQDTVTCVRAAVSDDGQVVLETWIGPPPCPEGFTQGDGPATDPVTTTTTTPTTTEAPPETTEPAPEETTTTTGPENTAETTPTSEAPEETPPAEAVDGEPTYTG